MRLGKGRLNFEELTIRLRDIHHCNMSYEYWHLPIGDRKAGGGGGVSSRDRGTHTGRGEECDYKCVCVCVCW